MLAKTPVSSQDVFLFHKTTNRAVYEAHVRAIDRVAHPDAFDVLLWNEAREVTEFTIGNVIVEIDGERYTPPRGCGLLGGTLRAELIEQGAIRERVITLDDLSTATRLWLINSVRGANRSASALARSARAQLAQLVWRLNADPQRPRLRQR